MTVALVLSGGGSHGDFQAGALQFLYPWLNSQGISRPDIICGTSVGAINGAKLAEGEGSSMQGFQGLISVWQSMQVNTDMYEEQPWLNTVPIEVKNMLTGRSDSDPGGMLTAPTDRTQLGDLSPIVNSVVFALIGAFSAETAINTANTLINARSVYNLNPIERRMRGNPATGTPPMLDVNRVASSGIKLRLSVVGLESGKLRYVTEKGAMLERDNRTPAMVITSLDPHVQPIADQIASMESDISDLQADMQSATGSAKTAIARQIKSLSAQITQLKIQMEALNAQYPPIQSPAYVDLISAVIASSTMPVYFPPVKMGENYVDGGAREIVPLQAAIDLGADTIYAIRASKYGNDPLPSFDRSNMFSVTQRTLVDIVLDEIATNDAFPPAGWPGRTVKVIYPLSNIHDVTTIDSGLIAINMAYGYMMAADVLNNAPASLPKLADSIVNKRRDIWETECRVFGQSIPTRPAEAPSAPMPQLMSTVRALKRQLHSSLLQRTRSGGVLPPGGDQAWRNWERHPWTPSTPTPWQWTGYGANEDWTRGPYYGGIGQSVYFADVTGDGRADAIVVNANTITVRRSTGSGFSAAEDWSRGSFYGTRGTFFADVDGDGRADAIAVNDNAVLVRRSTGSSFGPAEDWTHGAYYGSRGTFFADVDGDGRADAIVINNDTVVVRRSTGSSFGSAEDWTHGPYYGSRGTFFADVDGDGRADAIVVNNDTVIVRRSTGSGFGPNEDWTRGPYYSTRTQSVVPSDQSVYFADVDGDGMADALVVNSTNIVARRSSGTMFNPNENGTSNPYYGARGTFFADVDGDGRVEAIVVNNDTVVVRRPL